MTDVAAAYGMAGWPFWAVIGALFVIVMGRSHLFYWVGRGVFSGAGMLAGRVGATEGSSDGERGWVSAVRHTTQSLMSTPTARRGLALVRRWGPLAVTFAYLTVGVQTTIFIGSGLVRMPYLRFALASIPGSVAWAFIWGTVGMGAVWAAARLAVASPWALAGVVVLLVVAAVTLRRYRNTPRRAADTAEAVPTEGAHEPV